ncbi:MAG: hypothetical protein LBL21_01070 [Rickettsiales bacterium]|jgi:hypothetical protein|nr:hypothetical protein [Rickettsiales bacterium]
MTSQPAFADDVVREVEEAAAAAPKFNLKTAINEIISIAASSMDSTGDGNGARAALRIIHDKARAIRLELVFGGTADKKERN